MSKAKRTKAKPPKARLEQEAEVRPRMQLSPSRSQEISLILAKANEAALCLLEAQGPEGYTNLKMSKAKRTKAKPPKAGAVASAPARLAMPEQKSQTVNTFPLRGAS